jgi:hypothetical protein
MKRRVTILIFLLSALFLAVWWLIAVTKSERSITAGNIPSSNTNQSQSQTNDPYKKSDNWPGNVGVEITYVPPEKLEAAGVPNNSKYPADKYMTFIVAVNTHSGDLFQYKIEKLAFLRTASGKTLPAVPEWQPLSESSHHRLGVIRFPKQTKDGKPTVKDNDKSFEIVIKNIAGVNERIFKWNLPL